MRRSAQTRRMALCGILAALAVAVMFMGGVLPFATIACPVLASLVLIPVYAECGSKWGLLWFAAVALLSLLIAPEKESGVLFAFFGCYPLLRRQFGRLRPVFLRVLVKLLYLNLAIGAAYGLMIFVFRMAALMEEFAATGKMMLFAMLLLANVTFLVYDRLIDRLVIVYHAKLRSKLKL